MTFDSSDLINTFDDNWKIGKFHPRGDNKIIFVIKGQGSKIVNSKKLHTKQINKL